MSAWDKYHEFHGKEARGGRRANVPLGRSLVRLGRAVEIVYECDKLHGGGNGRKNRFVHKFETPVYLYTNSQGRKVLMLIGEQLKVTDAGIEN